MRYTQKRFSVSMAGKKATWPKAAKARGICDGCGWSSFMKLFYHYGKWLCEACKRDYDDA